MVMSAPVSYTHLDVYKRQVSSLHVDYDYENVYNIDKALEIYKSNNSPNTVSKHSHDIRAVSYTHLICDMVLIMT